MEFKLNENPSDEDIIAVRNGLVEYNRNYFNTDHIKKVVLEARGEEQKLSGGIVFHITAGMVYLEFLWVDAAIRKTGLGSKLLKDAEDYAKRLGCCESYVTTFSFQARPFYEKHGYKLVYTQRNYPDGIVKYHLEKQL